MSIVLDFDVIWKAVSVRRGRWLAIGFRERAHHVRGLIARPSSQR